jgi:hypothetical protein
LKIASDDPYVQNALLAFNSAFNSNGKTIDNDEYRDHINIPGLNWCMITTADVNRSVQEISSSSGQVNKNADDLANLAGSLQQIVDRFKI